MVSEKQKTIRANVSIEGVGLFMGQPVTMIFKPAPANHGIVFVRTDVEKDQPVRIAAIADNVIADTRRTTLSKGGVRIETCEHCLSALAGLGIDNVVVEVNGSELPSDDGSARLIAGALSEAGVQVLEPDRNVLKLTESVTVGEGGATIDALPSDVPGLRIVYSLDYGLNDVISPQVYAYDSTLDNYLEQIAPARTFVLEAEAAELQANGLGAHLTSQDLLVIGKNGPIDGNSYRFDDELVRHKVLDMIGDLLLLGCPINARIVAYRSGHTLNHRLTRELVKLLRGGRHMNLLNKEGIIDIRAIHQILPHRYPMLLIDRVVEIEGDKRAVGIKNVTMNEHFFQGHYPGTPIMPGVLIVEAMAQLSGVLLSRKLEHTGKLAVLMSMNNVKLRRPVMPGDQMLIEANTIRAGSRTGHTRCSAHVGKHLVAEAEIKFMMIDAEQ